MNGVGNQLLQQVPFFVEVTPDERRLPSVADHARHLLTAFLNGAFLFGPLLPQIGGRHGKQHALGDGAGFDQVVNLVQRRQGEPAIIKAKV